MSELLSYGSPHRREDDTATLGLLVLVASWSMLFAAALFADGLFRLRAAAPPPSLPRGAPALAEAVLVVAAAAMQAGVSRISRGRALELSAALIVALLLGLFFLGLEVVVWRQLSLAGVRAAEPTGAMIYVVTGMHAASTALGVAAVAALLVRAMDGSYSAARHLPVRLVTLYWHCLALAGLAVLALVFWI